MENIARNKGQYPKKKYEENNKNDEGNHDVAQSIKLSDDERLQKVIARAGIISRREAEKAVRKSYNFDSYD